MANKVTSEDIINFNKLYYKCGVYAQVARETGFSASTVRKYIDPNWKPADESIRKVFNPQDFPQNFDLSVFRGLETFGELCVLSEEEEKEIIELQKELEI